MKLRAFTCDGCGKQSELRPEEKQDQHVFPYDDNWIYVYKLEFKTDINEKFNLTDLHFCSFLCLKEFMMNEVAKERDARRKRNAELKSLFEVPKEAGLQEKVPAGIQPA